MIVVALITLFVWQRTNQTPKLLLLGFYSIAYLGTYIILPNRWETPFNSDPIPIFKVILNLPWTIFASMNPLIAIGGLGFVQLLDVEFLAIVIGTLVYVTFSIILFRYRTEFFFQMTHSSLLTKSFILIILLNYVLVFSASNSYWVKVFPLFQLDTPQHVWMRWSSVIPLSLVLIIASLSFLAPKIKIFLFSYLSIQWLTPIKIARPWLQRYW